MATAEQIKSLIRSHLSDDPERFYSIALQVAAHEARQGHGALATDIRDIINEHKKTKGAVILKFPKDMLGLVLSESPETPKSALVIPEILKNRINRIIHEFIQQNKLKSHGLKHRTKVLLVGPPGTGKTMTARVLAHELKLQLHTIQVDRLVTKFMGETSSKLREIFDLIDRETGVYLFDEFDAIGGERSLDNDVGEMRRVLNSFLQFIEQSTSDSIIVAATNNPKLLDKALFRRFDDVLRYDYPKENERTELLKNLLCGYVKKGFSWKRVTVKSKGLSYAEIHQSCIHSIKNAILSDNEKIDVNELLSALNERHESQRDYVD